MSGNMYDTSVMILSPEGKIFQVEYAQKAVDNGETIVGIKCKDGILLGAEKQLFSKLLVEGTNKRVYNIDNHIGVVVGGKIPDGRNLMNRARKESQQYQQFYQINISGSILAERIGLYAHHYTLQGHQRPFGSSIIFASHDQYEGYKLHMVEPSGQCYGYHACSAGKGKQVAKSEFDKREFKDLTCRQALVYLAKILNLTHEEFKEKQFEIEISWICQESKNQHELIPKDLKKAAIEEALKMIEIDEQGGQQ